ncbi:hypothetical protein DMH02_013435 [Streptomyces sp. WAC 00631]|nr:hypothetical protein [Streptomyces sp. WAC 00631]MCC5034199.1 hypothetical protein [Streptomyces sp. WAC 00631]
MRTIRITDFWRGAVLAPDYGSDVFLLVNVLPHDDAYTWGPNACTAPARRTRCSTTPTCSANAAFSSSPAPGPARP